MRKSLLSKDPVQNPEDMESRAGAAYYKARLENGELVMVPHCGCGRILDEAYYCDRCSRHCRCYQILCEDAQTLERVRSFIRNSPRFSGYTAHFPGSR
jgi:hypothetical protein